MDVTVLATDSRYRIHATKCSVDSEYCVRECMLLHYHAPYMCSTVYINIHYLLRSYISFGRVNVLEARKNIFLLQS